ncbi:MAG: hypothetical protein R2939_10925 [Kofleriaceae bacterium]
MSTSLARRGGGTGVVPAVASAVLPGLGQLVNGESDKAVGVFVVAAVCGAGVVASIPLIGAAAGVVGGLTWLYGVADGFIMGRRRR